MYQDVVVKRRGALIVVASTLFFGASAALAASPDEKFMTQAAQDGAAEVAMGRMAQAKGSQPPVKEFGERMVQDHSAAGTELKSIAAAQGVQLPDGPTKKAEAMMGDLGKLDGPAFDRKYMEHMVDDHKKAIALFEKEAQSGKDPQAKAFAQKTLPKLREHLDMAQQTQQSLHKVAQAK